MKYSLTNFSQLAVYRESDGFYIITTFTITWDFSMKIALVGGTGKIGSEVLKTLLARGHAVTALVRVAGRLPAQSGLQQVVADAYDAAAVARAVAGQDAVISAFNPGWMHPELYDAFLRGAEAIRNGVKAAGVKRLLVVGGAGSLFVAPGVQLVDTPAFTDHVPPFVVPGARAARDELTRIQAETELDWTMISPAGGGFQAAPQGRYRLGGDELLMDGAAPADIAVADLALAIVDEIEEPQHIRKRFTAAH